MTVDLSDANAEAGGFAAGDTLVDIDKIIGSSFNDSLKAGAAAMTLLTGGGQDTLQGGAGNDILDLKTDNTALNDVAKGGAGSDTFIVEHSKISAGTGLIDGESGSDTLQLHMASDGTLDFANFSSKDSLFTSINILDMSRDGKDSSLLLTAAGIRALVGSTSDTGSATLNIKLSANVESANNTSAAAGQSVTFNLVVACLHLWNGSESNEHHAHTRCQRLAASVAGIGHWCEGTGLVGRVGRLVGRRRTHRGLGLDGFAPGHGRFGLATPSLAIRASRRHLG